MKDEIFNKAEESEAAYAKKKLTFFPSFDEMEKDRHRLLASLNYEQRLSNLEAMRKRVYHTALLPDGSWPPLSRKLTIIKLDYEVCR